MNSIDESKYVIHSADYTFKPFENVTKGSGSLFLLSPKTKKNDTKYILKYKYSHLAINEIFSQMIFEAVDLPFLKTGILICDSADKRACTNHICSRYIPVGIEYIDHGSVKVDLGGLEQLNKRHQIKTLAKFLILSEQAQNKDHNEHIIAQNGTIYRIDTAELWLGEIAVKCFLNKDVNAKMFDCIYDETKNNCKTYGQQLKDNVEVVASCFENMGYDKQEVYEAGFELSRSLSDIDKSALVKQLEVLLLYYPNELIEIYAFIVEQLMICGKNISHDME